MSHSGYDDSKCGFNHHPCHTLSYTLDKRAKADDVIQINGQDGIPYLMKKQHTVLANITLIGTEGRAKIVGKFSVVGSYLFADVARGLYMSQQQVSINLVNLKLIRIGIIKLKNTLTTLNLQVFNCTVSKLSKIPIVDSSAVKTTVILKKSIISQVSKGLRVKSREVSLSIESSKINNLGRSYPERNCPQFIVTHEFESFVACFRRSSFKYTFLIDLGVSNQKKSNISILDSVFDDDGENFNHNRCFSGITLRNTTALIVNSSFTNIISRNSLIKAIASFVTFKKCIFSNISSTLGMLSLSSSIIGSFNKIDASHSKLNGFHYGSVYLHSTEGILQTCAFCNNTINGEYGIGGALYISNSNIKVQQSLFKENTVTYMGGAIYMQKTRGSFINCTFERNSAKSLPHKKTAGGAISSLDWSNITVQQSLFKDNKATYSGGAIYMQKTQGSFVNCTFERNSAKSLPHKKPAGGAISSDDWSNITVQQSLFKENTATYSGGAILMQKTRGSFVSCTFERNSAKSLPHKKTAGGAIFSLDWSNITVQQSLFKDNKATYKGGAIVMQKTQGSFVNCTFERNSAKSLPQKMVFGGAISSLNWSNITVQQSLFKENTATSSGGAIYMQKTRGSFVNCTFERNSAKSLPHKKPAGGAISSHDWSNITVQQSLFKENTATYIGGAIYMERTRGSFVNCTFERNSAKSLPHKKTAGGAIFSLDWSNITVQHSLFKDNIATYSGGAILMEKTRGSFVNCTFERNSAKSLPHKKPVGGAIYSLDWSNITVQQSLFKENTATHGGGAILMQKTQGSFVNCTFERNSAKGLPQKKRPAGGAIASDDWSNITVQQSLFKENTATYSGGAIVMQKTQGSFVNCTFERNSAKNLPHKKTGGGAISSLDWSNITVQQSLFKENTATYIGGAIYMERTRGSFVNCTFERNSAKSLPHKKTAGGAIFSLDWSNITVQQSLFKENTATYNGGAILMQKTRGSFVNCTFERNSAKSLPQKKPAGGAISSLDWSNITVQQSLFKDNKATYIGGAIYIQQTRGSFVNCTFEGNSAKSLPHKKTAGGAISSDDWSNITVQQSLFKENTATYSGGAILMQNTRGSFISCTFERNSAKSLPDKKTAGGAIFSLDWSNITVQQSLFKDNKATYGGGAIVMQKTQGSFVNCTFERNSAKSLPQKMVFGGAIYSLHWSNITVQQSLFKENTATYSGGAILMEKTRGSFVNCTFERNSAESLPHKKPAGGAISSHDCSNITVQQSLFKENTATYIGGAIYMQKTRGSFVNCTFERNSAKSLPHTKPAGGAISSHDCSNITVQQSLFKENTATYIGGAIYMQKTRGSFVNCTFERNSGKSLPHKKTAGGAISSHDCSNITVQQSLFKENTATYSGGAILMEKTRGSFVNCTFERNSAESLPHKKPAGGAISSHDCSNITVQQSLFKENTATYIGGAIYMQKTRGSFVNCTFERNSAKSLPHTKPAGGAISSHDCSNITVQQSLFKENTATYIGGAIYMQKTRGSFVNCTFERNSAKSLPHTKPAGGAIFSHDCSNITVQQSLFKENTATYIGGAIYMQKTRGSFVNCKFERNSGKSLPHKKTAGGAIFSLDWSNITVQQSLFKENTATYSGGAIYMQKTRGSFVNCTFERNSAKSLPQKMVFGGAISSNDWSNITVQQSLFKENTATYSGGAILMQKTRGSFVNCTFERNSAKSLPQKKPAGGAISSLDWSNITVQQSLFKENTATYSGGAIYMQKTRGSFVNCTFERNSAKSLPHKKPAGGAISSHDWSNITVQQSLFKENTATYIGGAIYMERTRGSFVNCTFERNSAKSLPHKKTAGGAIFSLDWSNITVQHSLFKDNKATYSGGAILMEKTRGSFVNCTFERNSAKSLPHKKPVGGAIYSLDWSNITVQQSLFKENTATHGGSAILMQKTRGSFVNCTFERNSAKGLPQKKRPAGGAIASDDWSNITVQQSLFKENTATYSGGAIVMQKTQGSFVNCTFERNSAKNLPHKKTAGGAISSLDWSNITVQQSLFKENTATYIGGAIYMERTRGSFVNCTFERNSAKSLPHKKTAGGAIFSLDWSNITVQHSLFKDNKATYSGGAILMEKTRGSFVNCTFERNSAKSLSHKKPAGGAIYSLDWSNITVQQSLFKENTATHGGGAILMQKTRGSFVNCTFERNSAKGLPQKKRPAGGAIASDDWSNITVQQSLFKENTATYSGGAIVMQKTQGSFVNCTFERNSAKNLPHKKTGGGAISSLDWSNITVQQSLFKDNKATYRGGAIYMQKTRGSFVNCTFERNSAKSLPDKKTAGGAIFSLNWSNITVQQSLFKDNKATYGGGAIYMQKTQGSFVNCTFERNSAKCRQIYVFGGAVIAVYFSYLTMHQCRFKENRAAVTGGALFIQDSQSSFKNCTFEGKV